MDPDRAISTYEGLTKSLKALADSQNEFRQENIRLKAEVVRFGQELEGLKKAQADKNMEQVKGNLEQDSSKNRNNQSATATKLKKSALKKDVDSKSSNTSTYYQALHRLAFAILDRKREELSEVVFSDSDHIKRLGNLAAHRGSSEAYIAMFLERGHNEEDDQWFEEFHGFSFEFAQGWIHQSSIIRDLMDMYFDMRLPEPNEEKECCDDPAVDEFFDQFTIIDANLIVFLELREEYDEYSLAELDHVPSDIRIWEETHGISFAFNTIHQFLSESKMMTRAIEQLRKCHKETMFRMDKERRGGQNRRGPRKFKSSAEPTAKPAAKPQAPTHTNELPTIQLAGLTISNNKPK